MARAVPAATRAPPRSLAGAGDVLPDLRAKQGELLLQQLRAAIDALDRGCARSDQRLELPVTYQTVVFEDRHRHPPQLSSPTDVFVEIARPIAAADIGPLTGPRPRRFPAT